MVIVPEALFVKNHIVSTFDLPEIEALKATLRQRLLEIEGKDTATRQTQGLACGLLRDRCVPLMTAVRRCVEARAFGKRTSL